MNRTVRPPCLLAIFTLLGTPAATAERAHQHGIAELLVAVEETEVVVELTSPAANLFGYEHRPRTSAQWQQADRALATLLEPATVGVRDGTDGCQQLAAEWETGLFEAQALSEHRISEADAGREEHDHHHHADLEHDDHHGHADVRVTYKFTCSSDPRTVNHQLFTAFADLSEISVSIATAQGQSAQNQHRGDETSISLQR